MSPSLASEKDRCSPNGHPSPVAHRPSPRHLISAADVDRPTLDLLFARADRMAEAVRLRGGTDELRGRVLATLLYEPSTRTRLSFEAAMVRLGGGVISTENAREHSSDIKGETLEDTAIVVGGYADAIVVRHYEEGAAARMASTATVPVINAGDGAGEHPTQALLDLYTMQKELGRVDGLRIALVGDLANGRTVHSLCRLLPLFHGVRLSLVSPPTTRMRPDVLRYLQERGVVYEEEDDLAAVAGRVDVLYQTRVQKERFASPEEYDAARGRYIVDRGMMDMLGREAIVMHPLPRVDELAAEVDVDPRAAYFRQARNGLFVRMALLATLLSGQP